MGMEFLEWLNPLSGVRWLELGCGTGSLTKLIVQHCHPYYLSAYESSSNYLQVAKENIIEENVTFINRDIREIPFRGRMFDYVASGLLLNFLSDPHASVRPSLSRLTVNGSFSGYVWDYAGDYELSQLFWNAAYEVSELAAVYDPKVRFSLCHPGQLHHFLTSLELDQIRLTTIKGIATFQDFEDYWRPLLSAQGSVGEFLRGIELEKIQDLERLVKLQLPSSSRPFCLTLSALAFDSVKVKMSEIHDVP